MSFIGNMLGISKGGQWAPSAPNNLLNPVNQQQIQGAQDQTQQGLAQQQAFLNSLQGQGGIANQSAVFNQLQGVANGTGPNPAQAMLNQATGNNVSNQAALMASQRGTGANTGLLARQAAMQGANTQQQAAGQAATMQANQSLGALGQLGGIAGQQVGQQQQALQHINQNNLSNQGQVLGAAQGQNQVNAGIQNNINDINQKMSGTNAAGVGGLLGGLATGLTALNPGSKAPGSPMGLNNELTNGMAPQGSNNAVQGGEVGATGATDLGSMGGAAMVAKGGMIQDAPRAGSYPGKSSAGRFLHSGAKMATDTGAGLQMAHGGKVPALVSPGEKYLNPKAVEEVAKGKKSALSAGEKIPGRPKVGGAKNSYANDTVPKTLDEGGIVLPRSVTQAKDPAKAAHAFVSAILARKGMK